MNDDRRTEEQTLATGLFPNRDARTAFLHQVQLWNSVEGLPVVHADSLRDGERVEVRTVASARRGIVRLIEAFGGHVVEEMRPSGGSDGVGGDRRPAA
jgi:hypothetical protein